MSHLVDEDRNELHGFDNGRVHKEHGKKRIPGIATQKYDGGFVAATRKIPISHGDVVVPILVIGTSDK